MLKHQLLAVEAIVLRMDWPNEQSPRSPETEFPDSIQNTPLLGPGIVQQRSSSISATLQSARVCLEEVVGQGRVSVRAAWGR